MIGSRGGRYSNFLYHDILRKKIAILLYITIFLYFHDSKVHVIILNKEIPNMDNFYLKLKSKYGPLLEYKFYQKFDDFYSSLCKKKL